MYIEQLCEKSKQENYHVLVGFIDQDKDDKGIDFDVIESVFDNRNILVGYLLDNDFYPREQIRWFRIQKVKYYY